MKVNEFDRFMKYIITFDKEYTKPIRVSITAYNISEYFTEEPSKHFVCIKNINFCFIYKDFFKETFLENYRCTTNTYKANPIKNVFAEYGIFCFGAIKKKE